MFTCSHCTFSHPFEWSLKEHMYVNHNDSSNLNINSTILSPPTKIYAGQNGVNIPTTVSIPPIRIPTKVYIPPIRRKAGRQSGMGVEYEDTDSEHGDSQDHPTRKRKHEDDNEDTDSEHGDTDEEMLGSEHEEHNHSDDENIGNDNEDTDSEHSDTDEEMLGSEHEEHNHSDDENIGNDNEFSLLHIVNDTRSIFEYCIKLRKLYRNALKQLNDLDEYDKTKVIESYAKLEVIVKDDQFGIENDNNNNNNESDDDFWDFVYELRDKVEEDSKMLNNYVEVEKEIILSKKDIEEDVPPTELNDIVENVLIVKNGFHKQGEECFETCSHAQIHSISEFVKSFLDSDARNKIRNFNPNKYDLIRDLMNPYIKSVEKIGNSDISIHEKRKTLQKTHVGETVINLITNVILPYLKQLK